MVLISSPMSVFVNLGGDGDGDGDGGDDDDDDDDDDDVTFI